MDGRRMWDVLGEMIDERVKQIDRGMDAEHDDRQPLAHWAWLLARRANDLGAPNLAAITEDEPRRLLVEIATIAVAALESLDRQHERESLAQEPVMAADLMPLLVNAYGEPVADPRAIGELVIKGARLMNDDHPDHPDHPADDGQHDATPLGSGIYETKYDAIVDHCATCGAGIRMVSTSGPDGHGGPRWEHFLEPEPELKPEHERPHRYVAKDAKPMAPCCVCFQSERAPIHVK